MTFFYFVVTVMRLLTLSFFVWLGLSGCVSVDTLGSITFDRVDDLTDKTTHIPGEGERDDPVMATLKWKF